MTSAKNHKFPGIYMIHDDDRATISTRSLVPRQSVYGEKVIRVEGNDYRLWSTRRSKLAAGIKNGLREMPIQPGSRVLYLGASSGTTVSHVSDIVGNKGLVYAVEFSPQVARKLIWLAESRSNVIPIINDARHPSRYAALIGGPIDVVYQDVAQSNQAKIFLDNLASFCSLGAYGILAIKARSIDSTSDINDVYSREIAELASNGMEIIDNVNLEPLEKDHRLVVVRIAEEPR
ncbi:MAG: fibrillarin-like rRNA/tRNA 2'-O-methyltransferase [Candidatus Thorarchaeota archaeon]